MGTARTSSTRQANDDERNAITAAAQRLLAGQPVRSTGALTVTQLAAEAGVKRWVLTHKHQDLMAQFQKLAREHAKLPPAFQALETENLRLQSELQKVRREKLEERLELYAAVINELSIWCHQQSVVLKE
ncbi:hypothetical protein ETD86_08140 [Nonomuraea turkmeniaca]|uniref:Transposase n=1 Tax=Nonomuraea turkmeniaca TaxID=103838 RepID=A0A5S4FS03_9ACTN|nr:hypothetical protein [Nonomuraea turkmeniaca]TMR23429.1 hypothetical protein ETD86_08140 [Nonomuraea turkmeniaca]